MSGAEKERKKIEETILPSSSSVLIRMSFQLLVLLSYDRTPPERLRLRCQQRTFRVILVQLWRYARLNPLLRSRPRTGFNDLHLPAIMSLYIY